MFTGGEFNLLNNIITNKVYGNFKIILIGG